MRDPHEWQICNLEAYGSQAHSTRPVRAADARAQQRADDIVVHCKMGGRSAEAYQILKQAGFKKIKNLKGGISAWADQVDPTVPKY